jgi:two-component system, NtrC family, response regulator HydG
MSEWRVLVVDDDEEMARAIADVLSFAKCRCEIATNGTAALALCRQLEFDVVVSDVRMEGIDGIELLSRLRRLQPELPVILVTAEGSIPAAVDAVKRGAREYITKPCDPAALRIAVTQAAALRQHAHRGSERFALPRATEELVGSSEVMLALRARVERVAAATSPVLVQGETGTGKELVARAIHACSARQARPFVTVNASAIPEALLESELFGHQRGAFTGAAQTHRGLFLEAEGGTLLLDEIGDMPLGLQSKLLRVLQSGEVRAVGADRPQHVDVRVVASTHRRLSDLVREGGFREDLYYRLNVVSIAVPPLRARAEDIPELAHHLLARAKLRAPFSPAATFSPALMDLLQSSEWPGNVRELESTIERLVVLAQQPELRASDLAPQDVDVRDDLVVPSPGSAVEAGEERGDPSLERLIQRHVTRVLDRTGGNKAETAKLLGVDLSTLYRWQRKWRA